MLTLFVVLVRLVTAQWFVGSGGWLGWLEVAVIVSAIVITLRVRRRLRRRTVSA